MFLEIEYNNRPIRDPNSKKLYKRFVAEGPSSTHLFLNTPLRGSFRNFKLIYYSLPDYAHVNKMRKK
jgi:hypothetical protein